VVAGALVCLPFGDQAAQALVEKLLVDNDVVGHDEGGSWSEAFRRVDGGGRRWREKCAGCQKSWIATRRRAGGTDPVTWPRAVDYLGSVPLATFTAALTRAYSTAWTVLANGCFVCTEQQSSRRHLVDCYHHSGTKSSGSLGSVHVDAEQHKYR
jgi:hypothetical protein